ncbi:MAG: FAD-dependent oxidoreductase, partial [Acidobacteria bacterium]|nr:FAD-dependent oxidoreductase [Acidobacteriota bacterium]
MRGIQEEWFTRLAPIPNAVLGPDLSKIGKDDDEALLGVWSRIHGCVSESEPRRLVRAVYYEPNQLKIEMDKMLLEHRDAIRVLCHSWGVKPIMNGNEVRGVIFESKEGRKAIPAKTVIDATGDGDIYRYSGTPFFTLSDGKTRSSTTTQLPGIRPSAGSTTAPRLKFRTGLFCLKTSIYPECRTSSLT